VADSIQKTDEQLIQIARRSAQIPDTWVACILSRRKRILVVHFDDSEPSALGADIMVTLDFDGNVKEIQGGV
jgi:hypothetical protein